MTAPTLVSDPELVLCGLSMVPIGFADLVAAAVAGGFQGISVGPPVYRRAVREGLSVGEMRRRLDDAGIWVSEMEYVGNWLTGPEDKPARWAQKMEDSEVLEAAVALGARAVIATHFGSVRPAEEIATALAALCDRAGAGLSIAVEFPAFATLGDIATAWDAVRLADRPSAGLLVDTWHYFRGRPDESVLAAVPPDRIIAVQVADADPEVRGSLEEDVLLRRLPGEGSLDVAGLVRLLDAKGVRAPIGIEVWDRDLLERGPQEAARHLGDGLRSLLATVSSSRST